MLCLTFDTEKCSLTFVIPGPHPGVLGSLPRHTAHKGTGIVSRHRGPRAQTLTSQAPLWVVHPCRSYPNKSVWSGGGR